MHGLSPHIQDQQRSPCNQCGVREFNLCGALIGKSPQVAPARRSPLKQAHQTAAARQIIYRINEQSEPAIMVCDGWACVFVVLPDGRRQILSVLLPGDIVSGTALLKDRLAFSIQALTELRYCKFNQAELKAMVAAEPAVFDEFAKIWIAEREEADQLVTDLGRRTADERMARFILSLMSRLGARRQVRDHCFPFPLRQRHIADATGLTPVHVSRVMSKFRKAELIEIKGRSLKVLNLAELRRIGNFR
jgi:CRP/FNR family transcriptional regulator